LANDKPKAAPPKERAAQLLKGIVVTTAPQQAKPAPVTPADKK
jgi:hypothetical protein